MSRPSDRPRESNSAEFNKYLDCLMSMCLDCEMGGITAQTFISNLKVMLPAMERISGAEEAPDAT